MWQDSAACKGMNSHIFLSGVKSRIQIAKEVCAECPVTKDCLDFAIEHEDFEPHVYGGMTGEERRRFMLTVA